MDYYTSSYDHESVTIRITGATVGQYLRVYMRMYDDTSDVTVDTAFRVTSTSFYKTFSDLEPETHYIYRIGTCSNLNGDDTDWGDWPAVEFVTDAAPTVAEWDWTISNGDATAAQTRAAYNAITNNGLLSDFNYLVWNDLVNKCYEVITARGGSWDTTYGTLSATLMTASNKNMTAKRFNSVWWQCSQYINTGMGAASNGYCPVATGDPIMGSYFIDLADAINRTIY